MLHERNRTYIFDGLELSVSNVRKLWVSPSGGHRLTQADGTLVYVRSGWYAIKIKSDFGWEQ